MTGAIVVGVPLLVVIALMCFHISRMHDHLAEVYRLVERMLSARDLPEAAAEADAFRERKIADGTWCPR